MLRDVSREPIRELAARADRLGPPFPPEFMDELAADPRTGVQRLFERLRRRENAYRNENEQLGRMTEFDRRTATDGAAIVAGVDEAGRGPIAGPVSAAAVVLPKDVSSLAGLNDSKLLTVSRRNLLYDALMASGADIGWGIVSHRVIDRIGIQRANFMAMRCAVKGLDARPDCLLVDGYPIRNSDVPCVSVVKGDRKSLSIAAASVIAKVTRDAIMESLDHMYPEYGFSQHKGYGTQTHYEAVERHGLCPVHRKSFFKSLTQQTLPFIDGASHSTNAPTTQVTP